ncbi:MAG: alcohol dehydrogenase catalytic domain-containing protein [Nitrospirae bacterium]|nr:alcohol dehydrogenase catalytic domain-containing protein [Nitrospirota bacterium]
MIAAYLAEPGKIEFREVPVAEPAKGEVVVKIKAALTCGTDLKAFQRGHPMIPMPGRFGHEFSGIIAKTGKGIKKFKEGDEVMGVHSAPCLHCPYCLRKFYNLCENIMSTKVLGSYAEYLVIPEHIARQNFFKKPSRLTFQEAAFLEPLACVVHGMAGLKIKKEDTVLIIGTGPIGLLHLLMAKSKGARVMVSGRSRPRLDFALGLGADSAVEANGLDSAVKEFTKGLGMDYVFECTGQLSVWESSLNFSRRGGTVVLFGGVKGGTSASFDTHRLHYDEMTVKGVFHFSPSDVKEAFSILCAGLPVKRLISGSYALRELPVALHRLGEGDGLKFIIEPENAI